MIPSLPRSLFQLQASTIPTRGLTGDVPLRLGGMIPSWVSSIRITTLPLMTSPFDERRLLLCHPTTMKQTLLWMVAYMIVSNLLYLARRAQLRQMTMWEIFRIRTTRESGISRPLFGALIVAWQVLVAIFPCVEPIAWSFGFACFFYSYPKAKGGGYILEPLSCQRLKSNQRTRQQWRLDWHRFKYNVGGLGRDGYRHPPTIQRNLLHIDIPNRQVKHWPWRRRHFIPPPPPPPPPHKNSMKSDDKDDNNENRGSSSHTVNDESFQGIPKSAMKDEKGTIR